MLFIVAGKPGTGKTYHMMSILVDEITEWMRSELKNGVPFDSVVYTNIAINVEGLNETVSARLGKNVDVSHYVYFCDENFFHDPDCLYWWKKFPQKSLIVIDEVHHYLGKKVEHGSLDLEEQLINYLSMHRHDNQELYFLSQHTDNFANQILGMADTLYEIVNAKNIFLPFPINLPMSDLDTLKRAFGVKTQYYTVNIGNYRGKAVKWSGGNSQHLMMSEIFRVYKSHTRSEVTSDRPEVDRTPIEGLIWFTRKHAWHLVPKAIVILGLPFFVLAAFDILPDLLIAGVSKNFETPQSAVIEEKTNVENIPSITDVLKELEAIKEDKYRTKIIFEKELTETKQQLLVAESKIAQQSEIVGLFNEGILLKGGRLCRIGDTIYLDGEDEQLESVDVKTGKIRFASGKTILY